MKLSFKLGPIPVHIHGSFLLTALFLGMQDTANLPLWIPVVFFGVLVHELGHALVGKIFGLVPVIDLIGMGGLTSWPGGRRLSNLKSVLVSLAGPLTGIAAGFLVPFLVHPAQGSMLWRAVGMWQYVNVQWGLLNLVPVLPLDGGNVVLAALNGLTKERGERPARIVSVVFAVLGGLLAYRVGYSFAALFAALFAFQNIQALRALGAAKKDDTPLREELQKAYAALQKSDANTAARHARVVVEQAADPALRTDGVRLLAFALLLGGSWGPLMNLLEAGGAELIADDELAKFERAASELGRAEEARRIGELRANGGRNGRGAEVGTPEAVKF